MVWESKTSGVQDFLHLSSLSLGPTQPAIKWVPGVFPVIKWLGRGVDHPPPSSAEVKERAELTSTHPLGLQRLF